MKLLNGCFSAVPGKTEGDVKTEPQLIHFALHFSKTAGLGGGDSCFFFPISLSRKARFTNVTQKSPETQHKVPKTLFLQAHSRKPLLTLGVWPSLPPRFTGRSDHNEEARATPGKISQRGARMPRAGAAWGWLAGTPGGGSWLCSPQSR